MPRSTSWKTWLFLCGSLALAGLALGLSRHLAPEPREVTTQSDRAYALYIAGVDAHERYCIQDAMEYWRMAAEADSGFAAAWTRLADSAYMLRHPREAKAFLARAEAHREGLSRRETLELDRVAARIARNLGRAAALDSLLAIEFPHDSEVRLRAIERILDHDPATAAELCRSLLADFPTQGRAYNLLGYALLDLEAWEESLEAFQKYVFLNPDQPNPQDSLGEMYLRLGRYDEATAAFHRALALDRRFNWTRMHQIMLELERGAVEAAATLAESPEVRLSDPLLKGFWDNLRFEILMRQDDLRGAEALALSRTQEFETDPRGWAQLARIRAREGRTAEVGQALERLIAAQDATSGAGPDTTALAHQVHGILASSQGHPLLAAGHYLRAAELERHWFVAGSLRTAAARAYLQGNDAASALHALEPILRVNPHHAEATALAARARAALRS